MKRNELEQSSLGAIINRLNLLSERVDTYEFNRVMDDITRSRDQLNDTLYAITVGTLFSTLTVLSINKIFSMGFPQRLYGVLSLFLFWGILFVGLKLFSFKFDRRFKRLSKDTENTLSKLLKTEEEQSKVESKLLKRLLPS